MAFKFNPFTGTLDIVGVSSSSSGITGPSVSTEGAIVTWDSTTGAVVKDNPNTFIQPGGGIQASAFLTDRDVITDVSIPSKYSWIAPNLTIELTGSIEIEADAELIIV